MKISMIILTLLLVITANAAEYSVPVNDPDLVPYATFDIGSYAVEYKNGRAQIAYTLPAHLTGTPLKVKFVGKQGERNPTEFIGDGKMSCAGNTCGVKYAGLTIDEPKREAFLQSISKSQAELSGRLQVGALFSADPGGRVILK